MTRIEAQLLEAQAAAAAAEREREWLEHSCAEIDLLAPEAGEETRLAEERAAMQAGLKAGESLTGLDELLGGSDGAIAQLRQAARRIERGAADHPLLGEALAGLDRALIEASEAEDRIARAAEAIAFDPARLEQAEARLFDIRGLARKHRVEPDELAALGARMRDQLAAIQANGEHIAELDRQLLAARQAYAAAADALGKQRHHAASRLDVAVAAELAPLKLDAARFRTAIAAAEPGPAGTDRVEFEVSTNPGAPFGPLTRIASGGELSRFILALKVALAEAGSAGDDDLRRSRPRGRRRGRQRDRRTPGPPRATEPGAGRHPLAAGRSARIPPLPYRKKPRAEGTRTTVRKLGEEERREEIARMLSGASITEEARAQATRLLDAA